MAAFASCDQAKQTFFYPLFSLYPLLYNPNSDVDRFYMLAMHMFITLLALA